MTSISRKLTLTVTGALLISTMVISVIMYFGAEDEISELYDENMKQIALALANQNTSFDFKPDPDALGRKGLRGEEEFLIQVWNGKEIRYSSLPAIAFPRQTVEGYGHDMHQDRKWYFYALTKNNLFIQVAQPAQDRNAMFLEVYYRLLMPILIQFPIVAFLVGFLVRQGFMPLRRISNSIEKRNSAFLEELPLKKVPVEIKGLVQALNSLLDRLSEALKLQRRFTADAAHELRTPLTAVKLQLDLLARARSDADRQEAMSVLSKGVDRSIHLVEQLLSLARQEPEALEQNWSDVDLGALVREAVQQNQPLADSRGTDITLTSLPHVIVNGQHAHLLTMIGNLVNNAIIYTPKGGKVTITLTDRKDHCQLDIADNGIGIAPIDQERIFDRFYRVTNSGEKGSGLGLSIVKSVADRHGVKLSVHSEPSTPGTLFRLVFSKIKSA